MDNKEEYRVLCEGEPSIPIYSRPFWMDAVCGPENWDVLLYHNKAGSAEAALPYCLRKKYGMAYITQPDFVQHNGVWIHYPADLKYERKLALEKEVITALIEELEKIPICFYQQGFSPEFTNWLPFYWKGYRQTTQYTYRYEDIFDGKDALGRFAQSKKNSINKATAAGFEVLFDLSAEDFYSLNKRSLQQRGIRIHYSLDVFRRMYKAAYENHAGRTIYTRGTDGAVCCALFHVWDSLCGYSLICALDPDYRSKGVLDLLMYKMIEYQSTQGIHQHDFEGSMIESVEASFRKLGGVQTPYFMIWKIYSKNPFVRYIIRRKINK